MVEKILARRDLAFLLYDWLQVERLTERARYREHSRETFDAALDIAERIATDLFYPHNRKADLDEPRFDGERVHLIPEIKTALDAFIAAGLMSAEHDEAYGTGDGGAGQCPTQSRGFHSSNFSVPTRYTGIPVST